ncbi:hypothetical protein BHM03_00051736 [Ensete ventricosum]|nr:hypothetical protein BHM03_00051736 [Ensete ventricosum]
MASWVPLSPPPSYRASPSLPFCPHLVVAVAHAVVLCVASGHLCPWLGAAALERQPLWAGGAASRGHLVRRSAHGCCDHRRLPLRVGIALQVTAPMGAVL